MKGNKNNMVIAIGGKQRSGKTTVAELIQKMLPSHKIVHIGDAIKDQYCKNNLLTRHELEENKHLHRQGLIDLGNAGRLIDKNFWLNKVLKDEAYPDLIVPDLRLKHEHEEFKKHDAKFIAILANADVRALRGLLVCQDDPTENDLNLSDSRLWHQRIANIDSYEDLKRDTKKVVECLISLDPGMGNKPAISLPPIGMRL